MVFNEDGESVTGALTFTNGYIDGSVDPVEHWQIIASYSGSIDMGDEEENLSGSFYGEFLGPNGEHISGELTNVEFDGATYTYNTIGYFGIYDN